MRLENRDGRNAALSGIGRLTLGSSCTAFFVRTPGRGPAYALSAGHCVELSANGVIVDRAVTGRSVIFNFFADTADAQVRVPVRRIAYSTMKGRDIAILELDTTQEALDARGVKPLMLADVEPADGAAIRVVGAPASFFDFNDWFLREARCRVGARAQLIEFVWHFWDTRRNDCADVVGGFSGSPVMDASSGRVMGILHTTTYLAWNTGGDFDCYAGRPCEIDARGQRAVEDTNYSVPVTGVMECFNERGEFDLSRVACPLDRGRQLAVTRRQRTQKPGGDWAAALAGDLPYYRWKAVAAGAEDCRVERGYSTVRRLADAAVIAGEMPREENRYLLCVQAGMNPVVDATWQPLRDATVVIARVDETPPVLAPRYSVEDLGGDYRVPLWFSPPELSGYDYKLGPVETTRCDEPGYRTYLRVPVMVSKAAGAVRFCLYAKDEADNTGPAVGFVLNGGPVVLPGGVTGLWGTYGPRFAPGQWISLYGSQLGNAEPRIRDAAGRERPLPLLGRVDGQINVTLPEDLMPGPAQILVGESVEPVEIAWASPVLVPVPPQANGDTLTFYAQGVARAERVVLRLGGLEIPVREAKLDDPVQLLRVVLPAGHGLAGRVAAQVVADGVASPRQLVLLP